MRRTVILLVLVHILLVFGVLVGEPGVTTGAVQPAAAQANDETPLVRSDEAKKELYLRMLDDFVPHAEEYWRSSDISEPNTGRYVATGPGVTQSRGSGNLAIAYATLLTAMPEKEEFAGVPREVMMDHLVKSIRHTALTNKLSGAGYEPSYTAFKSLSEGGATTVEFTPTVSSNAKVGSVASLAADLEYQRKGSTRTISSSPLEVPIKPLVSVEAITPQLPLAAGGWNRATLKVANHAERELEVRVVPSAPDGVSTDPASQTLELPASGTEEGGFDLRNDSNVNGTGRLDVEVMHGETGSRQTFDLLFSDNLALNPVDAQWPAVFSDSKQPNYPPALAVDGSTGTFWVSGGAAAGEGPTPAKPIALGVDFGAPVTVGSVTMRPRTNYGPKAYTIEVSQNGETWREVAAVPSAPNRVTVTTFSPTEARYLRLKITDSHDPVRPPRNVQVAELEVRAK